MSFREYLCQVARIFAFAFMQRRTKVYYGAYIGLTHLDANSRVILLRSENCLYSRGVAVATPIEDRQFVALQN